MSTELALVENNPVQMNKLFGFSNRPKPVIPVLRINGEDEEAGTAPKGTFVYDDGDKVLYANDVEIRAFLKGYQYRIFTKELKDTSIIALNFQQEFRSMSGKFACGKMNKKKYAQLEKDGSVSLEQKFLQDNVKCKLIVFGVVSGNFHDVDTKDKVEIKDKLFVWSVAQSAFMSVDGAIVGIEKERRAIPLTPIKITLKKEKNGQVTYFQPIPVVTGETAKLDIKRDSEYLSKIKEFIKDTNEHVNEKFNEAIKGKTENDNFSKVTKTVQGKVKVIDPLDLNDEVPF